MNINKESSFKEYKLGDICKIIRGIPLKGNQLKSEGFPVLQKGNIKNFKVNVEKLSYCDPDRSVNASLIKYKDIAITATDPPGKIGINTTNTEFLFTANIFKLECDEAILDKEYLYYYLLNSPQEIDRRITMGNVAVMREESLSDLKVLVPDLQTQKDIVKKMNEFEELREELSLRKRQHSYYRKKIMDSLSA